jgi:hypothetical protein
MLSPELQMHQVKTASLPFGGRQWGRQKQYQVHPLPHTMRETGDRERGRGGGGGGAGVLIVI